MKHPVYIYIYTAVAHSDLKIMLTSIILFKSEFIKIVFIFEIFEYACELKDRKFFLMHEN